MKAAICDDESGIRKQIRQWVLEYEKTPCQVSEFESGEALVRSTEEFDLIFLDIDMDGMNGIETARMIRKHDKTVKIIYVTSYREYVNGAFSVHAFAYLVKPVTKKAIFHQMDEVLAYQPKERPNPVLDFITDGGLERIAVQDIFYFEYISRKIHMHTTRGIFTFRGRILDIQEKMEEHGFSTPHKSFVINLYHVKNVKGYDIAMMNGDMIPLSQKKSVDFRKELSDFLAEYIGEE